MGYSLPCTFNHGHIKRAFGNDVDGLFMVSQKEALALIFSLIEILDCAIDQSLKNLRQSMTFSVDRWLENLE